ncbi:ABC transporter substrate-binding protein [Motiliproteus coralliicola]|uniref:ABC transporter substrate-binding protein n=1 Tax=Motiliproteus coralliicola TaxID=2283196 RepID=A0A369WS44_9GAMM|nr:extracellular solute-binding protein [Motiliproteus coralliicola]RDE24948.1 ABC transporter substrate-binding protein [Motiliproteus coralliicola]
MVAPIKTALLSLALLVSTPIALVQADEPRPQHAIAMHGTPKYSAGFDHFEYTNPEAPKGGTVRRWALGTFDSFNPFIIKGTPAAGVGQIYDSLMVKSQDEPFSQYGLLAESVVMPEDRSWIRFKIRQEAQFSDGKPVTSDDVIYSFKLLREQGNPFYRAYYADIETIEAIDDRTVEFRFKPSQNRELPLIVGEVAILPKHYWQGRDFSSPGLDIPVGSGPYLIDSYDPGRSLTYRLRTDYWGQDLPVNRGRHNYGQIRYDYYRDTTVALEAFKAGEYDFRQETSSKNWATSYNGPMFDNGEILRDEIRHSNPTGMQAFVLNSRRPLFTDSRVRQALAYAFDFEWTNKNIFYNAYTRTHSYFSNSEMAATELPDAKELKILEPIRDQLPAEVFNQVYRAPNTDGSGKLRQQLRQGLRLLKQAGWQIKQGKLTNAQGQVFSFELLLVQKEFERVVAPFIRNLNKMGIDVRIRIVDVSQYINRLRSFDYDMMVYSYGQSNSPGNEQREFWHSAMADIQGSRNLMGIKNPAIDYLVDQVISAPSREQLVLRTRALDRALQWNHYLIPQYHINSYRIAYWDKFGMPDTRPLYALGFDTWWMKSGTDNNEGSQP